MADFTPRQTDGVPGAMRTRYQDMLDGTHAEVVAADLVPGGAIRLLATYDGINYVPVRLDASTFAFETVPYPHHEIHAGSSFHCDYCQLVSDINDRSIITFRSDESTRYGHTIASFSASGPALVRILEAPTITDNTGVPLAI